MSHGDYNPPGVWCDRLTANHHFVYLRLVPPGQTRRRKYLIGQVRRHICGGRSGHLGPCKWRAFSEVVTEFPPLFPNRVKALEYLVQRWEVRHVLTETPPRASSHSGEDLWSVG